MQCEPVIAKDFLKKVTPYLETAKKSIDICVFDWRWYATDPGATAQLFNAKIVEAVKRGVKVRAIINSDDIGNKLKGVGVVVKKFISKHIMHCKLMLIDGEVVITGSHNYTQSAMEANFELSVILSDGIDTTEFNQFFEILWSR